MTDRVDLDELHSPCLHARPQAASQLHGICVFCYRDRLGAVGRELREARARIADLESALRFYRSHTDQGHTARVALGGRP